MWMEAIAFAEPQIRSWSRGAGGVAPEALAMVDHVKGLEFAASRTIRGTWRMGWRDCRARHGGLTESKRGAGISGGNREKLIGDIDRSALTADHRVEFEFCTPAAPAEGRGRSADGSGGGAGAHYCRCRGPRNALRQEISKDCRRLRGRDIVENSWQAQLV